MKELYPISKINKRETLLARQPVFDFSFDERKPTGELCHHRLSVLGETDTSYGVTIFRSALQGEDIDHLVTDVRDDCPLNPVIGVIFKLAREEAQRRRQTLHGLLDAYVVGSPYDVYVRALGLGVADTDGMYTVSMNFWYMFPVTKLQEKGVNIRFSLEKVDAR